MKHQESHYIVVFVHFEKLVQNRISEIVFNGNRAKRLPHTSNISFRFIEGEGLLIHLDLQGIAVSTGSACSSGTLEPSPVIRALGRDEEIARGAILATTGCRRLMKLATRWRVELPDS